jgi:hypothetical protein
MRHNTSMTFVRKAGRHGEQVDGFVKLTNAAANLNLNPNMQVCY